MERFLVARKDWSNAAAFIQLNPQNGEIIVYGKFYEDDGRRRRSYSGPDTDVLAIMPPSLIEEAQHLQENRRTWRPMSSVEASDYFLAFCEAVWEKAKEKEPWFKYESGAMYYL